MRPVTASEPTSVRSSPGGRRGETGASAAARTTQQEFRRRRCPRRVIQRAGFAITLLLRLGQAPWPAIDRGLGVARHLTGWVSPVSSRLQALNGCLNGCESARRPTVNSVCRSRDALRFSSAVLMKSDSSRSMDESFAPGFHLAAPCRRRVARASSNAHLAAFAHSYST